MRQGLDGGHVRRRRRTRARAAAGQRRSTGTSAWSLLFGLGNSTDAFLLLRLSDVGVGAVWIPLVWAALHVVKAVVSPIGGIVSDRLGRRGVIIAGWLVYAAVYGGFAVATGAARAAHAVLGVRRSTTG